MKYISIRFFGLLLFVFVLQQMHAQKGTQYMTPPQDIVDIAMAPPTPGMNLSPSGAKFFLSQGQGYQSIDILSQPELKIAGLRINPRTNGPSRVRFSESLLIGEIGSDEMIDVTGLPADPLISNMSWSPNESHIGFTLTSDQGIALWVADVQTGSAKALTEPVLNAAVRGMPYTWVDEGHSIMYKSIMKNRGDAPSRLSAPEGPVVQESGGRAAAVRTYQDLIKSPTDANLFEYYAMTQLQVVNLRTEVHRTFGKPGIVTTFEPSPNEQYILLSYIKRPFSYLVPYYRFTTTYIIADNKGDHVKTFAEIPAAENIPKGFDAVRMGPRNIDWRADKGATLYWAEAVDGGDPKTKSEVRDKVYMLEAPFNGQKVHTYDCQLRFGGIDWGDDKLAIVNERWWKTRHQIVAKHQPANPSSRNVLFDRSTEDRYGDPGDFVMKRNDMGKYVLAMRSDGSLFLSGQGASEEGNRPFVRSFSLKDKSVKDVWKNTGNYYEFPVQIIDAEKGIMVTRREAKTEPPNYYLRNWKQNKMDAITDFPHPYPSIKGISKQELKYKRSDGVELTANLYLPEGFKVGEDEPLPAFMWAYPREFKSAANASQRSGSPHSFIRVSYGSPIFWVTRGYAVIDAASMPIVGEGDAEPNDSFREQLVMNAQAAIDKVADMKAVDRDRVCIGGHSYGAFMTANLLAHSNLFAAGIARSGAYNRTLTPFGFQREERTYWEAPEIYYTMSPFMHADKVNEPILLIHGEADNNSGTFPIQSQRYFHALKGMGATARLVMLPHESHGYRAKESILHMLYEQDSWLEKYVKNGSATNPGTTRKPGRS